MRDSGPRRSLRSLSLSPQLSAGCRPAAACCMRGAALPTVSVSRSGRGGSMFGGSFSGGMRTTQSSPSFLPTFVQQSVQDAGKPKRSKKLVLAVIGAGVVLVLLALTFMAGGKGEASGGAEFTSTVVHPSSFPLKYKIMVVSDLDRQSADGNGKYRSVLKEGVLSKVGGSGGNDLGSYEIVWLKDRELVSGHNEAGRGMELSELLDFEGHLLAMDDRTGIVFEVVGDDTVEDWSVVPRHVFGEGDGSLGKGMKFEWATRKDDELVLGSFGKEYTNSEGKMISQANNWVIFVDKNGKERREDWTPYYEAMRKATGSNFPGYMIHEAGNWSPNLKKWVFLPRRWSNESYDDELDESKGTNKIVVANENFSDIELLEVGKVTPTRGFSSFKFLPGTGDSIIVAMKSEELAEDDSQDAFLTIFSLDGRVLLEETRIPGKMKFEGLEVWSV